MQLEQPPKDKRYTPDAASSVSEGTGGEGGNGEGGTTDPPPEGTGGDQGIGGATGTGGGGGVKPTDAGAGGDSKPPADAGRGGAGGTVAREGGVGGTPAAGGGGITDAGRGGAGTGGSSGPPEGSCTPTSTFTFPLEAGAQNPSVNLTPAAACFAVCGTFAGWGCTLSGQTLTVNGQPMTTCGMTGLPAKLSDGCRYIQVSAIVADGPVYNAGNMYWY